MTAPLFSNLVTAATPVPVVVSGAVNTSALLATGKNVLGILDVETMSKVFNPVAEGNAVASGDAASKWLPSFNTSGFYGGVSGTSVSDNYWTPVFDGATFGTGGSYTAPSSTGMVTLQLTPAAANVVEAPSVMTYKVSPQAIVLLVPSTTAF